MGNGTDLFREKKRIFGDASELVLEKLSIRGKVGTLRQEVQFRSSVGHKDLRLCCDFFLKVHGPGHSVFREHGSCCSSDILQLLSCSLFPIIQCHETVIEVIKTINKLINNIHN